MSRWIVVVVVLAVLGGGLVWMTRSRRPEQLPALAPEAAAVPPKPMPTPAPVPTPPPPPPSVSDAPSPAEAPSPAGAPVAPADARRESDVRGKIDAVLGRYPGVATVRKLACQTTGACQVEIEVRDLNAFGAPLERLQEPESGLSGDHAMMILSKPEPLGADGGAPFLFKFAVTPPEGGGR